MAAMAETAAPSPKYLTGDRTAINQFIDLFDVSDFPLPRMWMPAGSPTTKTFLFDCDGQYCSPRPIGHSG